MKTSQETEKSLRKFLESSEKPKVIDTDSSLKFAHLVQIYHGIIEFQHLIDPRQLALLKGTSAALPQSGGLDEMQTQHLK